MSKRSSSMGSARRLARLLSQHQMTGTDKEIALAHEVNRQSAVKEILLHVFLMSNYNLLPGTLQVRKAENQYLVATGDNEAAHCAPGQIWSGSRTIQSLITGSDDLQLAVENLFARTDSIHLRFNMADSRAEENGLRAAFGDACLQVARVGRSAKFNRAEVFCQYVESAFNLYKVQGIRAFQRAIGIQTAKFEAGEPLKGTTRPELITILKEYKARLESSISSLETVILLYPEDIWRDYASTFKTGQA